MDSFGVHRLRPHFGVDHNVLPPQCFSHFLWIFILYPPTGSLPVHRNRRLFGEEPQLIPCPLFLLFVNQDQNMYYFDRMYQCMYWKICQFSSTPTLISKRWALPLFGIKKKGRNPWWRPLLYRLTIYVLAYPFVLFDPRFDHLAVGPPPFESWNKGKDPWSRSQLFRWRIYILEDPFGPIYLMFDRWGVGPPPFNPQHRVWNPRSGDWTLYQAIQPAYLS